MYEEIIREFIACEDLTVAHHYCSFQTASKIISSRNLWASDLRKVKGDPHELNRASEVIRDVAEKGAYLEWINPRATELLRDACIHIAFLSQSPTSRSQWDEYAEQGTGCAIGLRLSKIRKLCGRGPKGKHLGIEQFPIIYDRTTQTEIIQRLLDEAVDIENRWVPNGRLEDFRRAVKHALVSFVGVMKGETYRKEQEWRIQADHDSKLEVVNPDGDVCRRALPICSPDYIDEIVVGPNAPREMMHEIRSLLDAAGGCDTPIRRLAVEDFSD